MEVKRCPKCGEEKNLEDFRIDEHQCRPCLNAYMKEWRNRKGNKILLSNRFKEKYKAEKEKLQFFVILIIQYFFKDWPPNMKSCLFCGEEMEFNQENFIIGPEKSTCRPCSKKQIGITWRKTHPRKRLNNPESEYKKNKEGLSLWASQWKPGYRHCPTCGKEKEKTHKYFHRPYSDRGICNQCVEIQYIKKLLMDKFGILREEATDEIIQMKREDLIARRLSHQISREVGP